MWSSTWLNAENYLWGAISLTLGLCSILMLTGVSCAVSIEFGQLAKPKPLPETYTCQLPCSKYLRWNSVSYLVPIPLEVSLYDVWLVINLTGFHAWVLAHGNVWRTVATGSLWVHMYYACTYAYAYILYPQFVRTRATYAHVHYTYTTHTHSHTHIRHEQTLSNSQGCVGQSKCSIKNVCLKLLWFFLTLTGGALTLFCLGMWYVLTCMSVHAVVHIWLV